MPYRGKRPRRPPENAPQHMWDAYAEDVRFYLSAWDPADGDDDCDEPAELPPIANFMTASLRPEPPPEGTDKRDDPESIFYRRRP